MKIRKLTLISLAASVMLVQPQQVTAGADDIVGGVIGGIIAGGIMSQANKPKRTYTTRSTAPRMSSAQRQQNRQVQTSLNYFGFPAGVADGVLGSRSRSAISEFQMYIGYTPTGYLSDFEQNFLIQSYTRAQAGGFATQQTVASLPDGPRGLIRTYRDQQLQAARMQPYANATAPVAVAVAPQVAQVQPAPVAPTTVVNVNPVPQQQVTVQTALQPTAPVAPPPIAEVATAALSVPNFMADEAESSVTSHCNLVNLRTSSSGGYVTQASMGDPMIALDEQFCLARTYAIADGDELIRKVKGVTPAQIEQQCTQFGPLLKDHVSALSFKTPEQVMQDVGAFVLASGISPNQLKGTAEICLAVGYRTDNLDVTLGSALLLTVLGERPYAELMGHHLVQGFGTSRRNDLALTWYAVGLDALNAGASPVFAPGLPERNQLLRASVTSLVSSNGGGAATQTIPAATTAPGLPTFAISQ